MEKAQESQAGVRRRTMQPPPHPHHHISRNMSEAVPQSNAATPDYQISAAVTSDSAVANVTAHMVTSMTVCGSQLAAPGSRVVREALK